MKKRISTFVLTLLLMPGMLSAGIINFTSDFNWLSSTPSTLFTLGSFVQDAEASDATLVLNFNESSSSSWSDESIYNHTPTTSGTPTAVSGYFGNAGGFARASSQYVTFPSNAAFDFGTGDYTIHCWIYFTAVTNVHGIVEKSNNSTTGWTFHKDGSNLKYITYGGSGGTITSATSLSAATWYHLAVVRYSGTTKIYINGTADANTSTSSPTDDTTVLRVALNTSATNFLDGRIDALQIIKGRALWTANFTPPSIEPSGTD